MLIIFGTLAGVLQAEAPANARTVGFDEIDHVSSANQTLLAGKAAVNR